MTTRKKTVSERNPGEHFAALEGLIENLRSTTSAECAFIISKAGKTLVAIGEIVEDPEPLSADQLFQFDRAVRPTINSAIPRELIVKALCKQRKLAVAAVGITEQLVLGVIVNRSAFEDEARGELLQAASTAHRCLYRFTSSIKANTRTGGGGPPPPDETPAHAVVPAPRIATRGSRKKGAA